MVEHKPLEASAAGWHKVKAQTTEGIYVTRADEGRISASAPAGGEDINLLATADKVDGLANFLEYTIQAGRPGPPPHWHSGHDELFYVVSGTLSTLAGTEQVELGPRDFLFVPRGAIHSFSNKTDETCIFIGVWTPGGHESFFQTLDELSPEEKSNPETLTKLLPSIETFMPDVERLP
jgi:mannose-6-phosphate isomerase-like protein (cupin superfamily)